MIFSIFIILLLGIIAFFHYVQGFFSATISAMICVLAAVLAVSYDETAVNLVLKGKMADQAHSIMLCAIFAVVYIFLRVIFDTAIPGNVRVPGTLDKVGSALMGIVAGIFVTGIFAIAVQMLPFDPGISLMGYGRYALHDDPQNPNVLLPSGGGGQSKDTSIYNEMDDNTLAPDKEKGLLVPVDDIVLNTVYHLSDGGSLAGDRSLASIHPDYLQELFGERLGIQTSARRSALYTPTNSAVDVSAVFTAKSLPAGDGQVKELRPKGYKVPTELKPGAGETILVVRVKIAGGATDDSDQIFRFSTGSVRMVGPNAQGVFKDYYPVGMLESGTTVLLNKPDDYLFVQGDKAFDAVFVVDSALITPGKPYGKLAPGVFLTVKRFANLNLEGQAVKEPITPDANVGLIRNKLVVVPPPPPAVAVTPAATPETPSAPVTPAATDTPAAPVTPTISVPPVAAQATPGKDISDPLTVAPSATFLAPGSISVGTTSADPDAKDAPVAGGTVTLKTGMILAAKVDPTASLSQLNQGVQAASLFSVPTDRTMIQAIVHPYENNWDWIGQLSATALIDSNGNSYPLSGFYILVKGSESHSLFLRYDASHSLPAVSPPDGTAESDIYLVFLIPHETDLKTLKLGGKQQNLDSVLHVQ